MHSLPAEKHPACDASADDDLGDRREEERERLIDNLALLVVRQHHRYQRAEMTEVPSHEVSPPPLNSKRIRGI